MKKLTLLLGLFAFTITTTFAQSWNKGEMGKGPIVTKTLNLSDFNSLSLNIAGNLYLRQGNRQQVEVEGQQNIIDLLTTEVKNNHWKIKFDRNVSNYKNLKVYVTIPDLTYLGLSGSGDIVTQGKFTNLKDVGIGVSGSGNLSLALDARDIKTRLSGSGDVDLSGSGNALSIQISGSGNVSARELSVNECEVRISGSGDVRVDVRNQLEVAISGSGDVQYSGNPSVRSKVSGSGEVSGKSF